MSKVNQALGTYLGENHGRELDVHKNLSYGVQNAGSSFIDERQKTDKLAWELVNETANDMFVVVSSLFTDDKNVTIFADVRDMLGSVVPGVDPDQVHAFQEGLIFKDAANKELKAASKTPGRFINQLLRYVGQAPTRIVKARITSTTVTNERESSNFNNEIKTMFFSPFAQPIEKQLALRPLVKIENNFNDNVIDVDFIDQAFPMILSNEHFIVLQVNALTKLNFFLEIGAQDSMAQRHWRQVRRADDVIRQYGLGK